MVARLASLRGFARVLATGVVMAICAPAVAQLPAPKAAEKTAPDEANAPSAAPENTDALPDALPPLDLAFGEILGENLDALTLPEVRLLGFGRIRLEFDEGRRFQPSEVSMLGLAFTGRAGFEVPVGDLRARLIFGDGIRLGPNNGSLPHPLVARDLSSFLYEVNVDVAVPLFGLPVQARLGRMPLQIGDGRYVGTTPFDPRGRTYDGALAEFTPEHYQVRAGIFANSTADVVVGDAPLTWLAFVDAGAAYSFVGLDVYAFAHRDLSTLTAVNAATLGGRGRLEFAGLLAEAGVDVQAGTIDLAPFSSVGQGVHGEVTVGYFVEPLAFGKLGTPYVRGHLEGTYGATIDGKGFRAPGGNVHAFLGALDLFAPSNVAEAAIEIGLDDDALAFALSAHLFGILDRTRPVLDPRDRVVWSGTTTADRFLMTEVDAHLQLQFARGTFVEGEAAVGLPGPAFGGLSRPAVRLLCWVRFDLDIGLTTQVDAGTDQARGDDGP